MDLKQRIALKRQQAEQPSQPDNLHVIQTDVTDAVADQLALVLSIDSIEVKQQGRRSFDNLDALAEDIRNNGQLQPVIVKSLGANRYQLIAGERRFRAIRDILQQPTILARVRDMEESEHDLRFVQIAENAQREDYLPLELASELADLKAQTGMTIEQMAKRIGKSKGFVSKFIGLVTAPEPVRQAIAEGQLTATAWFNNKSLVNEQLAGNADSSEKAAPPQSKVRTASLPITLDAARDLARILQKLAADNGLAEIDVALNRKTTKKQLQAILVTRAREIADAL